MNKLLKTLAGRLLIYFGGLLTVLGFAGIFTGSGSLLVILPILGVGLLMIAVGAVLRF